MQPKRFYQQLKATTGDVVTLDITTSNRKATFRFDNVDAKVGREWCYGEKIRIWLRTQVDQPGAGGAIIRPDQLYRILSSIKLSSDDLGVIYNPGDINGPALGLIAQVVSNGYALPFHMRENIAAADGDSAIVLPVDIPLAHKCFYKGHQTGVWNGFLKNGGQLEIDLADSTALAAVSTGAALEATTDVRAELVYTMEPEARPPVIWHWRLRDTPAGETKHTIRNMCQGAGLKGASGIGKLAFLAYLSDQNGLGGPDGIDNIQRVYPRDRGQPSHNLATPFFGPASFLASFVEETRRAAIFESTVGNGYPYALGTAINGAPNAATALFLPYIWPHPGGRGQEVSKLQEVSGDYVIEHDYGTTPTAVGKWLSLEQSYLTDAQEDYLQRVRMALPPEHFRSFPKVRNLNDPGDALGVMEQQRKLRGLPKKIRGA